MPAGSFPAPKRRSGRGGDALDLLHREHLMHRKVLSDFKELCEGNSKDIATLAVNLRGFLREEYLDHRADEEEMLFPLLRKRCLAEDKIDAVIHKIELGRKTGAEEYAAVIGILVDLISKDRVPLTPEIEMLQRFVDRERRQLIAEDAIILPIARCRLTKAELNQIYISILRRRGFDRLPWGSGC